MSKTRYNKRMHIILGGTSGLGLDIANSLRERGSRVLVIGRLYNEEQHGEGFELDLYDRGTVNWFVEELARRLESDALESFIWTAGYGWRGDFSDQPEVRSMAEVNFAGALPLVQLAWRQMIHQEITGKMVVVSSTSGVKPRSDEAVYAATKHAQVGLSRCLGMAAEEHGLNAQVLLCLPGAMKTPFWSEREPEDYAAFNDPQKVAQKIVTSMFEQTTAYAELVIPHGSLT